MVDNNFDSLPWLDLFSKRLDDMPNLFGSDVDNNQLHQIIFNYLTISRRRRGDYKPIFTEPKAK